MKGEIDIQTGPTLVEQATDDVQVGVDHVRLDLSRVTFLDSSGVTALLRICDHVERIGASIVLVDPAPMVRRILEVLGVDAVAPVVP